MPNTIFVRKPVDLDTVRSGITWIQENLQGKGDRYYVAEELHLTKQEWEQWTECLLDDHSSLREFSEKNYPITDEGVPCLRVTTPDSEIALIIDTQGYNYARYVGIETVGSSEIEEEDSEDYDSGEDESSEIDEDAVQDALMGLLYGDLSVEDTALEGCRVRSFKDAAILTYNKGLVISLPDGSEFQLTIVQSR